MYVSQKRYSTIGDIIDVLCDIELTPKSLEQISSLIEKEWFLCEERYGGLSIVTSQLNSLNLFITEKFVPMLMSGWFNDTEESPRNFLMKYLMENVSEETKRSQLFYSNSSNLVAVLSH